MTQTLRILILEENPADAELVQFELQEAGFVFTAKVVMTEKDFVRELHTFSPDLILSDYDLPHYNGAAALAEAKRICPDAPFILITGSVSEDRAIEMLTQGAKDYVFKDRLRPRLVLACRRSLAEAEEHRARKKAEAELREAHRTLEKQLGERTAELRESRERLSLALTSSGMGTFDWDIVEDKRHWDANLHLILGTRPEDFSGTTEDFFKVVHPEDRNAVQAFLLNALEHDTLYDIEYRAVWPDKSVHYVAVRGRIYRDNAGRPLRIIGTCWDITERKRAEEARRDVETRHRLLFEHSPVGIVIVDPSTARPVEFNETAHRQLGYSREEFARLSISDIDAAETPEETRSHIATVMTEGRCDFETRHRTRQGEIRNVHVTAQFSELSGRQVYHCIWQDITDRTRAEEQIRKERDLLDHIMDTSPAGITVVNRDGRITFANKAAEKILGLRKDAISQRFYNDPLWNIVDVSGGAFAGEKLPFRLVMDSGASVFDVQHGIEWPDGRRVLLSINAAPLYDESGEIAGMVASLTDITDRRQAEEKLRESENRFRQLFTSMSAGFAVHEIVLDREGRPGNYRFLSANPAFERLTGLQAKDLIGRTVLEVMPNIETSWIERYGRVALTGESVQFESYSADLNRHYEVTAYSPAVGQFATIFQDITERKRAEEEKAKLQNQLLQSQKMESIGRLAGGVAHDFNNMLGVILGHAEIAMEKAGANQVNLANLEEIRKAAQRSAELTRQLLAFARKQTVSPRVLDLNKTIEAMLTMLRRLIGEDIQLRWLPAADLWWVKIDPSQIDQILANLLVNARDAIAGVGKVTIETANISLDNTYCGDHVGFVPGDYIRLAVSDDGCGMDKEILGKLFEPFFTTKVVGKGTGLGLSTIYGIVKQNSGFINVYSEPGQGTTFKIYLPRHVGKAEQVRTESPQETFMRGHETVLVVEDEAAILNLCKLMLEKAEYRVLTAGTPGEAIRLAEEHTGGIHLLMTDVVMPEMNGRDLAKKLLSLYPNLKRLFMSGYTADVIAHHGVLDEGAHFLQKPFSTKDLVRKVREALDGE